MLKSIMGVMRIGKLFVLGLPRLVSCRFRGENTQWWSYEYNRLVHNSKVLFNVNRIKTRAKPKRALMCYIIHPFLMSKGSQAFLYHTNMWRAIELAKILDEHGYVVDVITYDDHESVIDRDYDLLLGFGRANELTKRFSAQTIKLYLATGSEANLHNWRERERVLQVNARRSCNLPMERQLTTQYSDDLESFDAIACLGNEVTASTYRSFFKKKIYCFNNHGYDHLMGLPKDKNLETSRGKFLFFGSVGQVLFGLDLLLEVFVKRPHLELSVCGPYEREKDFVECYRKELYDTPNIHPMGWVPLLSETFLDLVKECGMVIVPICSAGSPGSVVVCMGKGLIPVVTKEAGIDTEDFGITLPSCNISDIGEIVDWISSQTARWHEEMHYKVFNSALRDYSQKAFSRRFREILREVIKSKTLNQS